jgi:hypothetical protein
MKNPVLLLLFLLSSLVGNAQNTPDRKSGECLIQLQGDEILSNVLQAVNTAFPEAALRIKKEIAPDWRMYALYFDEQAVSAERMLDVLRQNPAIASAQLNHRVPDRDTEPNDPDWWRQSDMTLIGTPKAWDLTTGGLSANGDTIVVAVLEKGALMTHPDLVDSRHFNYAEIPNNLIDDDGNGYIDDYAGYDARNGGDGPGTQGSHGTGVNGIIGARGNNAEGVSGVNWNIQLLNISNTEYEDEIIDAYYYVSKARERYNNSQGTEGSFIVATNASFGIDRERAEDHPMWCAVYDALGEQGVLSVGATSNSGNNNIDIVGDMPTDCASEYLVTVTNVDKLDNKVAGAGYGPEGIDLGAPGQDTYTTSNNLSGTPLYATLGGTSAAAPHVTGSIALLYSMSCTTFTEDALTNPSDCAKRVRDVLLDNVSPNSSLDGLTKTGGRLDIGSAAEAVLDLCGGSPLGPMDILEVRPNPVRTELYILYQTPSFDIYEIQVYNMLGQEVYKARVEPQAFVKNEHTIDMQYQPNGLYTVFISRNKVVSAKKFLKI